MRKLKAIKFCVSTNPLIKLQYIVYYINCIISYFTHYFIYVSLIRKYRISVIRILYNLARLFTYIL